MEDFTIPIRRSAAYIKKRKTKQNAIRKKYGKTHADKERFVRSQFAYYTLECVKWRWVLEDRGYDRILKEHGNKWYMLADIPGLEKVFLVGYLLQSGYVFLSTLRLIWNMAVERGDDPVDTTFDAVFQIQREFPAQCARVLADAPTSSDVQDDVLSSLSGWCAAEINLSANEGLREYLSSESDQPYQRLLEELPAAVRQILSTSSDWNPSDFRNDVARLLEGVGTSEKETSWQVDPETGELVDYHDQHAISVEDQVQLLADLREAYRRLDSLPEQQKMAVWLRECECLSYKEGADRMHISVEGFKTNLSEGREKLRKLRKQED